MPVEIILFLGWGLVGLALMTDAGRITTLVSAKVVAWSKPRKDGTYPWSTSLTAFKLNGLAIASSAVIVTGFAFQSGVGFAAFLSFMASFLASLIASGRDRLKHQPTIFGLPSGRLVELTAWGLIMGVLIIGVLLLPRR